MRTRLIVLFLVIIALFIWGCPKDDEETPPPTPPTEDLASGTANSSDTTTHVITTPAGASVTVPPGAIPTFEDGSACTQTFSIERNNDSPVDVPSGETIVTDIYRFGPEGFVFAAPVTVTIPVPNASDSSDVYLYRTNQATGDVEQMPAIYDPVAKTLTAQTYEFCCWFGSERPARNTASGCIHVNNGSNHWVRICVVSYDLTYPDQDTQYMASYGDGGLWAPPGTIGFSNESNFTIPQGTFNLCIQYGIRESMWGPEHYVHRFETVTVGSAWNYYTNPNCSVHLDLSNPVSPDTGRCNCVPQPTSPAHTGEVQVTLTWFPNDQTGRDMDLHVVEPSGEEIYYSHPTSATGGQLDIDNTCVWNANGLAENIYWTTNPPSGEYIVRVRYYPNSCGTDGESQSFGVRTVVRGTTRTFQSSATYSNTVEVCRFSVSGGSVVYLPPQPFTQIVSEPPKH